MKQITFTGTLTEVHQQVELWKAANPLVTIFNTGSPVGASLRHRQDIADRTGWSITVEYEDPS